MVLFPVTPTSNRPISVVSRRCTKTTEQIELVLAQAYLSLSDTVLEGNSGIDLQK